MKISVITVNGSEYGFKILNYAKHSGIDIYGIVSVNYGLFDRLQVARNMYIRKVGLISSVPMIAKRLLADYCDSRLNDFDGHKLVRDYKSLGEHVIYTNDLKDPLFLENFKKLNTDILLLGQIGILGRKILSIPRVATLNAHGAFLPEYRGNHVLYWTIYFGDFSRIGYTIHKVDGGVDTGDIVSFTPFSPVRGETISKLFYRMQAESAKALVRSAKDWERLAHSVKKQPICEGRTYVAMPYYLMRCAEKKLQAYLCAQRPVKDV